VVYLADHTAFDKLNILTRLESSALTRMIKNKEQDYSYYNDSLKWSLPFLDLLMSCIQLEATDPLDQAYGLLGLGGPFGIIKAS
jgi:hypothetical protein